MWKSDNCDDCPSTLEAKWAREREKRTALVLSITFTMLILCVTYGLVERAVMKQSRREAAAAAAAAGTDPFGRPKFAVTCPHCGLSSVVVPPRK